jgi:hypothetical protein
MVVPCLELAMLQRGQHGAEIRSLRYQSVPRTVKRLKLNKFEFDKPIPHFLH